MSKAPLPWPWGWIPVKGSAMEKWPMPTSPKYLYPHTYVSAIDMKNSTITTNTDQQTFDGARVYFSKIKRGRVNAGDVNHYSCDLGVQFCTKPGPDRPARFEKAMLSAKAAFKLKAPSAPYGPWLEVNKQDWDEWKKWLGSYATGKWQKAGK